MSFKQLVRTKYITLLLSRNDDTGRTLLGWGLYKASGCFTIWTRTPRWVQTLSYHWSTKWRYNPRPVYWQRYSRDCDQYAVEWVERHPTGWAAWSSYCAAMDNAEGPERFSRITKAEYDADKNWHTHRDHAAEQAGY